MSEPNTATSTPSPSTFTFADAHRYVRRRRVVLAFVLALIAGVVAWRASIVVDRNERRALCERQRATTELIATVDRRFAGLVQVQAHTVTAELVPPARGDVVIGPHGAYLVGEGRVLPLDASCAKAVP